MSDLRRGRDATFQRRVDGLLANKGNDPGAIVGCGGKKEADEGDGAIENYARRSIDGDDRRDDDDEGEERRRKERTMKRLVEMPPWLPPHLAAFAATSVVEVPASRWKAIRAEVSTNSGFSCTSWDFNESAAVFRGRFSPSPPSPSLSPGADSREDGGGVTDCLIAATFARLQDRVGKHAQP